MLRRVVVSLVWSQIALFCGLGVCIVLIPHFLFERNEGGVSNYGLYAKTVVPFSLAFLLCSGLVVRAARLVPGAQRRFGKVLYAYAGLLLLVLATTYPYKLNNALNNLHDGTAIVLFWFEMGASLWLALAARRDLGNICLLVLQLVGFGLAMLTFFGRLHVLLIAQLVTSLAFGLLLIRTAAHLEQSPAHTLHSK